MQSLFADPRVIANLQDLHAGIGVAIRDFSPERAELVRRLNQAGVPVIAGLLMSPEQGYYFNAENAPEAGARFVAFDAWSRDQGLRWDGVGLDIEPTLRSWQLSKAKAGGCLARCSGAPWMVSVCSAHDRPIRRLSEPCDRGAISFRHTKCHSFP